MVATDLSGNSPSSLGETTVIEEAQVVQGTIPALAVTIVQGGAEVTAAAGLTVKLTRGTLANGSGSITLGGTAQNAMAANSSRVGFMIQNISAGDLWINTLTTAVADQPSIKVAPGQLYETPLTMPCTGAVSIIGATTGQKFVGREW